jgi:hypothetical protein
MKLLVASLVVIIGAGCAHQYDLMKANAVSMKHRNLPKDAKLEKVADVSSRYCMQYSGDSGVDIGLMDEAVRAAEEKYGIDFILHPTFRSDGKCVIVTGDGMRIKS